MNEPEAIILAEEAEALAKAVGAQSGGEIPVSVARSVGQALAHYSKQSILFGDPNLIAEVLPEMPTVRWVQSSWAGVTPLLAVGRRDYVLTGLKDVFGQQMAEYVLGYLLAHELKILERAEAQRQRRWFDVLSGTLDRKALGLMGTGSIGRSIASLARTFGLRVRGYSRSGQPVADFDEVFAADRLEAFLHGLDYLVSVLPETAATDRLLDARSLALLPTHAYFVNVGRGNVVDEAALVAALHAGALAGAALDVFDREPLPGGSPLWSAPNLRITGHVASPSNPHEVAPIFVENFRRFVRGEALHYVVDFERGY
jgi:phosphoglycerate dehydrogenase-like enzyme